MKKAPNICIKSSECDRTMSRPTRNTIPDVPYHITQRGNHQMDVFFSIDDRKVYLQYLEHYSKAYELDIQAYCLMSNHIHLIGIPRNEESISRTLQVLQVRHSNRINRINGWTGNLWQQRYFSCPLNDIHTCQAIRYVEQNPVRAGLVEYPWEYAWSSASCHCGLKHDPVLNHDDRIGTIFDNWIEILAQGNQIEQEITLQKRSLTKLPLASRRFIQEISG
jgi:putative transposase